MEATPRPPTPSNDPASTPDAVAAAHGKVLRPTAQLAEAMSRGYEPKDISLRGLFIFLFSLAATLVVVLAVIYGIMMALVERDRTHDPLGTPVSVNRPEVYAPLQPSVTHNVEDWEDMTIMRQQVWATLHHPTLARQMPIEQAMGRTLALLVVRPAVAPLVQPSYPPGSIEGVYTGGAEAREPPRGAE